MMPAARLSDDVLADVQGFITSGYGHLRHAAYLLLEFRDGGQARRWINGIAPTITSSKRWPTLPGGEKRKPAAAVNLGITADGLEALGVPAHIRCTFPVGFGSGGNPTLQ
jgi:hypothetical protein